jgi:DNA-binding response OmpR family regulator
MPDRILIVEDEAHLAQGLLFNLQSEGYEATVVGDGESALAQLSNESKSNPRFDAVLLDAMLPGITGFVVVESLRAQSNYVPVLMLTARNRPEDIVLGFQSGADDYLAKPFELNVLLARLHGLLRRKLWSAANSAAASDTAAPADSTALDSFEFAGRRIDFNALELSANGKTVHLTLMEAGLLRYLIQHQKRTVSRKELLENVWRMRDDTDTRAIDYFIVRLRRYIEDEPSQPRFLKTVRGIGYRFSPEAK